MLRDDKDDNRNFKEFLQVKYVTKIGPLQAIPTQHQCFINLSRENDKKSKMFVEHTFF